LTKDWNWSDTSYPNRPGLFPMGKRQTKSKPEEWIAAILTTIIVILGRDLFIGYN
jgi:hypothetical protein